ncbi:IS66 family insertion sequence element accessory protein TnpB, partial [Anaerovibrio lipolyticus]|uniref:IS66 family insertion sequence element accessory protein TnpB n=1 Tax=Anaerovibrio lipolyticus TaxID=82374 RepID=UPI0026EA7DB3
MLVKNITAEHVFLACGHTDMRKSIDGLAAIVQQNFKLAPFSKDVFMFCGRRKDRIKALFSSKSERTQIVLTNPDQLSLFDEAEQEATTESSEEATT